MLKTSQSSSAQTMAFESAQGRHCHALLLGAVPAAENDPRPPWSQHGSTRVCLPSRVRGGPFWAFPFSWLGIRGTELIWKKNLTSCISLLWLLLPVTTNLFSYSSPCQTSDASLTGLKSRWCWQGYVLFGTLREDLVFCSLGVVGWIQVPVVVGLRSAFPSSSSKPGAVGWIPLRLQISLPSSVLSFWPICLPFLCLMSHVIRLGPPS